MRSVPNWVSPTMPSSVMPSPRCASIVPQAERGRPAARQNDVLSGTLNSAVRSAKIGERADDHEDCNPDRERRQHRAARRIANVPAITTSATPAAAISRCATPGRSPRFQASSGPNGTASSRIRNSGPKVALKNGAPTEIFSPVSASSASG